MNILYMVTARLKLLPEVIDYTATVRAEVAQPLHEEAVTAENEIVSL
jgi:hypothetical protein